MPGMIPSLWTSGGGGAASTSGDEIQSPSAVPLTPLVGESGSMDLTEMQKRWLSGGGGGGGSSSSAHNLPQQPVLEPAAATDVAAVMSSPPPPTASTSATSRSTSACSPSPLMSMARQDSFGANCSVVSSLSGDGESVGALGMNLSSLDLDGGRARSGGSRGSLGHANNARSAFRKNAAAAHTSNSDAYEYDCRNEVSLSLSASSEETMQTGSVPSSMPSGCGGDQLPPPPPDVALAASQTPFLNTMLERHQRRQQLQSRSPAQSPSQQHRGKGKGKNRRDGDGSSRSSNLPIPYMYKRTASGGSLSSCTSGSLKRQLSTHAPLRDRLAGTGMVSNHNSSNGPPVLRRPLGLVGRSRSTPVHIQAGGGGTGGGSCSCNASVCSAHSYQSGGALSCSALGVAAAAALAPSSSASNNRGVGAQTPPLVPPSYALSRTQSNASLQSYRSTASSTYCQSSAYTSNNGATASSVASDSTIDLVLGDGRVIENVKRRNTPGAMGGPGAWAGTAALPGHTPDILAGRPMRHRRVQSATSASAVLSAVGTENVNVRKALTAYNAKNDTQCVQSYREVEIRKKTNVVKEEIKYKLGKIVPRGLTAHRRNHSFGGVIRTGAAAGGAAAKNDPKKVELRRASGCLT